MSDVLAKALLAAQKEMPAVDRDGVNPHFSSRFTTLDNLIAKTRPVLNKHGIALVQMPSQDEQGKPTLTTRLIHESGDSIESSMPLLMTKSDPQALGSALTYAKRYALAAALAIADQEDDDGNAAQPQSEVAAPAATSNGAVKPSEKQFALFEKLVTEAGSTGEGLSKLMAWAHDVLTGGKEGSMSKALEGLMSDKAKTCDRLEEAANEWALSRSDTTPETNIDDGIEF